MPLPIAHACIGASIATALAPNAYTKPPSRVLIVVAAFLAVAPDLDFFFVWVLRMGSGWHRGFAHSIVFALLVASLVAVGFRAQWKRALPVLCAATVSHCLLDTLTSRLAPGAELFWPFFSRRYNAGFVDYFDFSIKVRGSLEFSILILKISLVEAIIFIPLFLMVRLVVTRVRARRARQVPIEHQQVG